MMKVMTLNPPFWAKFSRNSRSPAVSKGGCVYYPIWLGYTTGALENAGFEVKLFDSPAESRTLEESLDIVKNFNPRLIVMDTVTASFKNDIHVAKLIKEMLPETKILLVGTHVSALPDRSLQESEGVIDWVAREEYDMTAVEVAQKVEKGETDWENVKGLSFQRDGQVVNNDARPMMQTEELDKLPFVSEVYKRHVTIENYFYPSVLYPEVTVVTGRGCKYRCTFCKWPQTLTGHQYRARSPKNIVDEFEWINENLPQVKDIMIEDDTMTQDRDQVRAICEEIIRRGVKVTWTCNSRADVDLETIEIMKKAGCRLMCVGFESGVQEVLNNIKKGTTLAKIEQFMIDSKKAKMLVHGCFMMGNRGETKETIQETIKMAKRLDPDTAQFFPIMVYPGTEAYHWAEQNGFLTTTNWEEWLKEDGVHNTIVSTDKLSAKELVEWCDEARRQFYMRPTYIAAKLWQGLSNPREFPRLFKSSRTFFKYLFKNSKSNA